MSVHGGIACANNATTDTVTTTPSAVKRFTSAMTGRNVTSTATGGSDGIVSPNVNGNYRVWWKLEAESPSVSAMRFDVFPRVNDLTDVDDAAGGIAITAVDTLEGTHGAGFIDLDAGDEVKLYWVAASGSNTMLAVNAQLTIERVGEKVS